MTGHAHGAGAAAKRLLLRTGAGRIALVVPRALLAVRAARILPQLGQVLAWTVRSREIVNFSYETTRESQLILAATIAELARCPLAEIVGYVDELAADKQLAAHVIEISRRPGTRWSSDPHFLPGRRLAFYVLARALKPKSVVEAGVDKGLGALLVSRALERNAADGHPGDYLGIEFDAAKPIPLYESWAGKIGAIVRGDSLAVLSGRREPIDLFIHDTLNEAGHLTAQLETVKPLMARDGVAASTWTTPELIDHAVRNHLKLLTHQEITVDHWFPGDRVAFLYGYAGTSDQDRDVTKADARV